MPTNRRPLWVHRVAASTYFAAACWLVLLISQEEGRVPHRLADGLAEWSVTMVLGLALVARGIYLGRPITAAHTLTAALLLGLGLWARGASLSVFGDALMVAAAAALVAPTASRADPDCLPRVWGLVSQTHGDPLAPFAMHSQKSHYFSADGSAAVAYRTRLGLAVVSGDPVGNPDAFTGLVSDFITMCRLQGWRVAVLGCSQDRIALWRRATALGDSVTAVPIGCDVEVDVPGFSMLGRRFRNLRQAVSRTHNRGITTELVGEHDLDEALTAELAEALHSSHHGSRLERGFSMILDGALEGRYPGVVLVIGRDAGGVVQGFHRYLIAGEGSDVTLDVPWRRPGAPNGLDERLAVDMIQCCKTVGTQRVSLAFAAFPDLFDNADRSRIEAFYYRVITLGGPLIRLESLYRYLQKFHALGMRRYVLVSLRHIPLALVVLLTLEFLPRRRTLGRPAAEREKMLP